MRSTLTALSWRLQLRELPFEEPALVLGVGEVERPPVRDARFIVALESPQELRPGGVEVVIVVEVELVDELEARERPFRLRDGDCSVQLDDR